MSERWTSPYEWDLLRALAAADACREPWAISHRRVFGGRGWMVQDLGRHNWLAASIPPASLHRAARALITKGLVKLSKISGGNYYALTEAGKARVQMAVRSDG